jgi:3-hydroxyisobutyrate dehydrogenase-like beta-hydroxyacid dehydrogenase
MHVALRMTSGPASALLAWSTREESEMTIRVGFIGAGLMGHGMAKNLVEKGFPLAVLGHRNRTPIDDLIARGATEADSPAALARASDVVILCVPSSAEVEHCILGEAGILEGAHQGLTVIDATTAEPASTEKLAAALAAHGVRFADAPLTRSPKDAEAGLLNTLVGADAATFAAIRPILETYCENIFHVGPVGAGHKMKLINNFMSQGMAALIAEAATTATKAGVDLGKLFEVVSAGGANSSVFQRMMPWVIGSGEGGMIFKLRNGQKDVRDYTHLAETVGATAFIGEAIHQVFWLAVAQGEGDSYVPALARGLGKANGVRLGPRE